MVTIPLLKPHMPELGQVFLDVVKSGNLSGGSKMRRFEDSLSRWVGSERVVAVNSFNSAIYVALATIGVGAGDKVIASPMGCLASLLPVRAAGVSVVWADVDPLTGTLDPASVERCMGPETKAVIHNHFCGYPGRIDEINEVAHSYGVKVIDDGIEAFGAQYRDRSIGASGADATVFSFGPVRIPNTVDGGAVVVDDEELFERARLLRDCGVDRSRFRDSMGEIDGSCDVLLPGISAKMSELNAFIGLSQMEYVEELLNKQKENADAWESVLVSENVQPVGSADAAPSWWVFGVLAEQKKAFIEESRSRGFWASGVHADLSQYSIFGGRECDLPGVDEFASRFVALPCGWWVERDEIHGFSCS